MNYEYAPQFQKQELEGIETALKELSEGEYRRDTPQIVACLNDTLDRIEESIRKYTLYWENFTQYQRVKDYLAMLEPKLKEARETERLKIEEYRSAGHPL